MSRFWRTGAVLALGFLACDNPAGPSPPGTGGLALRILPAAGGGVPFDSGYVIVHGPGPTDTTVKATPGGRVTVNNLKPGPYTVGLEGFAGGGVSSFQQLSVTIVVGQTATPTVSLQPFGTVIDSMPSYTTSGQKFAVVFSKVTIAANYVVQKDSFATFATTHDTTVSDTSVQIAIPPTGPYYVRVAAVDPYGKRSTPSAARQITTFTQVVVTPSSVDSLIGTGDTVRFTASGKDPKGNAISGITFAWTSSNAAAATVNSSTGLVTAVANGTSTITATGPASKTGTATFKSASVAPSLVTTLNYNVSSNASNHPMSAASNGSFYYTISDGGAPSTIRRYTLAGVFLDSTLVQLDARALLYSPVNGNFYVKIFGFDWYRVNVSTGDTAHVFTGSFAFQQSSPGISADGGVIYEHESDTVRVLDFVSGKQTAQFNSGFQTGAFPSNEAIAADGSHLFTWDGTTVYMYDVKARFITSFTVPNGNYGFSLSFANGLLWTTTDIASGTGTWYGYRLVKQ